MEMSPTKLASWSKGITLLRKLWILILMIVLALIHIVSTPRGGVNRCTSSFRTNDAKLKLNCKHTMYNQE